MFFLSIFFYSSCTVINIYFLLKTCNACISVIQVHRAVEYSTNKVEYRKITGSLDEERLSLPCKCI